MNIIKRFRRTAIIKSLEKRKLFLEQSDLNYKCLLKETKFGEPVLVYWPTGNDEFRIIHLASIYKGNLTHSQINLYIRSEILVIADLQVLDERIFNKGYGSLLMEMALEFAKNKNVKSVSGDLMTENEEHLKRQKHFYKKHGFEIINNKMINKVLG